MPKNNSPKEDKNSFFEKLAILLAPVDEKILHTVRTAPEATTKEADAPARPKGRYMDIRPMQVIKI